LQIDAGLTAEDGPGFTEAWESVPHQCDVVHR
jgi:hypothetical protein